MSYSEDMLDLRENWRAQSICGPEHDAVMFPGGRSGQGRDKKIARAKAVCARCPVEVMCRSDAIDRGEQWGVWGGIDFADDGLAVRRQQYRRSRTAS